MKFKEFVKKPVFTVLLAVFCIACLVFTLVFFGGEKHQSTGLLPITPSDASEMASTISSENQASSATSQQLPFTISSPASQNTTVTSSFCVFSGTCDPTKTLTINNEKITPASDGSFSCDVSLKVGQNNIVVDCDGNKLTYSVTYRYIILKSYSPKNSTEFEGGSTMVVRATARLGSVVTASFNGKTITLTGELSDSTSPKPEFIGYFGSFDLPQGKASSQSLGSVSFTAKYNNASETFKSGTISVKKNPVVVNNGSSVTPSGGQYMNVGAGYIAEVIADHAETFDGKTVDDYSRPTNSYLPKGTVDYCSTTTVTDPSSERVYRKLRCGKRVYQKTEEKDRKFIKTYVGTLPKNNTLNIASCEDSGRYTVITLDTAWKAPFYFDLLPMSYTNAATRDYRFGTETYTYVDITFCYANALTLNKGTAVSNLISSNNPVFSKAEIIKNKNDYTLRLRLKNKGKFYGWTANYNKAGQLVFEFLHPATVTKTNANQYGADLSNVTVFLDVGHGGKDPGAVANNTTEANLNLTLALKIKAELEKTGCHVVIDRTSNSTLEIDDRMKKLKACSPDLAISVHRNSSNSSKMSGYNTYYYHPYSRAANQLVYKYSAGLYSNSSYSKVGWHYFFLGRVTNCPVILTENGYMSNSSEFAKMKNNQFNNQCAVAATKGIVEYFLKNSPAKTPSKPAESKPTESKPAESKPAESKPMESKPTESKPMESLPAESKPLESEPQESKQKDSESY